MRLATLRGPAGGAPLLAARIADGYVDLALAHRLRHGRDLPALGSMLALMDGGPAALDAARDAARCAEDVALLPGDAPLLSPVPVPRSLRDFSVFATHIRNGVAAVNRARGTGPTDPAEVEIPEVYRRRPIYYKGNPWSVVGHGTDIVWPSFTQRLDYELEFGVFLWRGGRNIPAERAGDHIFGYTLFNDFSARDVQLDEMAGLLGPAKGKDFDTGNAIGPWIVTADEIPDGAALTLEARINGEVWSRGSAADMLHRIEDMIAYVSRDETLRPGEFFGSGTVGFGCGMELGRWLRPGDLVELHAEAIGTLANRVIAAGPA